MNGRDELIDSLSEDARREYERLKALVSERVHPVLAESLLVLFGTGLEMTFRAADAVREKGIVYVTNDGQLYERPEVSILMGTLDEVRKTAETLGVRLYENQAHDDAD